MQALLGNFALILFVLMLVTGVVWFADVFFLSKQRRARADAALAEFDARVARDNAEGIKREGNVASGRADLQAKLLKQPAWIEYSGSFFPVIALVFCLRSFLYEPFKIPSSSMVPTLLVGDLILVNKYTYGIRLPIINKKIIEINDPQRGDVMVFKYPKDTTVDYIKRVVGVPGDKIVYKNKRLTVNGEEISYKPLPDYLDEENLTYYKQWQENLTGVEHKILTDERAPNFVPNPDAFPHHELCTYNAEGFACTVPQGEYFMMGDNRDNSLDSRYWGFVPDRNIVGKAFFVWMNLGDLKRIGSFK
ncbi:MULTISPECIES: signal peptidase I [unclassified Herbaspirillum]|uniref:signal peptidase I n=1 Tax=unclassified Herbaspirillum TaxID=2624150 RepID=UPI001150B461|nr:MULTISPECIES: signal peptidase I [unclassified Herbaspirillum]MBB5392827.1 signal peptidase I [Herbaspirillum sp. SJZ102]TQK04526.1 signal peptidase I [Herbaspirillum sp. SJZ130]TQK09689.1 signal peptidase I [Herbaspirillum sp. SJZ106]TWC64058.1 signal peptidase I [Herbaspirillum sp. SJZ099]